MIHHKDCDFSQMFYYAKTIMQQILILIQIIIVSIEKSWQSGTKYLTRYEHNS